MSNFDFLVNNLVFVPLKIVFEILLGVLNFPGPGDIKLGYYALGLVVVCITTIVILNVKGIYRHVRKWKNKQKRRR